MAEPARATCVVTWFRLTFGRYLVKVLMMHPISRTDVERPGLPAAGMPPVWLEPGRVEDGSLSWPLAAMRRESFAKGDVLFKAGDRADKMFYVIRGAIRLPELNVRVAAGQVIGEMGILSPLKQRTASAVCEEDLEAYTMDHPQVIQLFRQDPSLALNLVQLSFKRFIENSRAEAEAKERIRSELRIAHEIQTSMLPHAFPAFPERSEFETYAVMEPAREVGGDFYDFFTIGRHKVCVLVGDASGKGISAALFMAIAKALLKSEAQRGFSPARVLSRVNTLLCPDNRLCMFVTVCCLLLDTRTGELECCSGGHNLPVLCTGDGQVAFLDAPAGVALGVMAEARYCSRKVVLRPGDSVLLYTDGVTEAADPRQQLFSEQRLLACVARHGRQPVREIIAGVRAAVASHVLDEPQSDDLTMLVLRYKGPCSVPSASAGKKPSRRVRLTARAGHGRY